MVLFVLGGCARNTVTMNQNELDELATRYAAAWSSQHPEELASFYSENGSLVVNDGTPSVGREAIAATAQSYMTAFPDMVVRMDSMAPAGNGATFYWTWTGTNTGPGGTGRPVRLNGYEVWTLDANGLITLSDGHFDQAEYERQLSGTFTDGATQYADESFVVPDGKEPRFTRGAGPVVGVDEAHHNYHTAEGRYLSFANLLRNDGYRVKGFSEKFAAGSLENVDVLVVSNALSAEKEFDWSLPTPLAFEPDEVAAVAEWVRTGGRLMLIADHMPFPGAAANLAGAFGVTFNDAYAYRPGSFDNRESQLVFSKSDGLLADHEVTREEGGGDVPFVVTFTGQAFGVRPDVKSQPLLMMADDAYLLFPEQAGDFDESARREPGKGLLQGALIEHGMGRVAIFGEAAMFSAQIQEREKGPYPFGMNNPAAPNNARFLLNVMYWLAH